MDAPRPTPAHRRTTGPRGPDAPSTSTVEAPTRAVVRLQVALVAVLVPLSFAAITLAVDGATALGAPGGDPVALALLALLATGWILPLARLAGGARPVSAALALAALAVATIALTAGGLWTLAGPPDALATTALAVVLATALTPPLVGLLQSLREWFAVGAGLGVAVSAAARGWLGAAPPGTTAASAVVLTALAAAAVVVWLRLWRADGLPTVDRIGVSAVPLGVFLLAEAAFLGSPHVVARWVVHPYVPLGALAIAGALAGAWWVDRPHDLTRRAAVGWGVLLVVSLAALLWFDAVGMPFLLVGQAAAVVVLGTGCRLGDRLHPWRATVALVVAQLAALSLVALREAVLTWDPVPALLAWATVERGGALLLVLAIGLVLAVLLTAPAQPRLAPRYQRYRRPS